MENTDSLEELRCLITTFLSERNWGEFNSPKNLSMSLASEAGEVIDHFRWLTEEQSYRLNKKTLSEVQDEMGDVMICLLTLADKLNIDLIQSTKSKLKKLELKYPKDAPREIKYLECENSK